MEKEYFIKDSTLGERFWPLHSETLEDGRTNLEWYFDTFERGMFNIRNDRTMRPFELALHEDYSIFREAYGKIQMTHWEKYLQPGWDDKSVAPIDGNSKFAENDFLDLPEEGFQPDVNHCSGLGGMIFEEPGEEIEEFKNAGDVIYKPLTREELLSEQAKGFEGLCGHLSEEKSGLVLDLKLSGVSYQEVAKNNTLITEDHVGLVDPEAIEGYLPRGVVPGDFVVSHTREDGKLDYLMSYTKMWDPGSIIREDRCVLGDRVAGENISGNVVSFGHVGHDLNISNEPPVELQGLFGVETVIKQLEPLRFANYLLNLAITAGAVFAIVTCVWGTYFYIWKTKKFLQTDIWDPEMRYWHPVDHRSTYSKELNRLYSEYLCDRICLELTESVVMRGWALEHGYGITECTYNIFVYFNSFCMLPFF